MLKQLLSRINRFWSKKDDVSDLGIVQIPVPEQVVREKIKGDRDFTIKIDLNGTVSAYCKSCNCSIATKESQGLLWFKCSVCRRISFNSPGNVKRDIQFAIKDGRPLEHELYYMKDLPPVLHPPF